MLGLSYVYSFIFTICLLTLDINVTSAAPFNVSVFVAKSCEKHGGRITEEQVRGAFLEARRQFPGFELNISITDTCSEFSAITQLVNTISSPSLSGAVIGPGMMQACESAATLANQATRFLLSYRCTADRFSDRQLFQTFRRTVSNTEDIARALVALLGPEKFMWKRVAIFYHSYDRWHMLANDIQRVLTMKRFDVRAHIVLQGSASQEEVTQKLRANVDSSIKGNYVPLNAFIDQKSKEDLL